MTTHTDSQAGPVRHDQHPAEPPTRTADGEGPAYWFFDSLAVVRTPEDITPLIIEMTIAPGGGAPLHFHPDLADSFYMIDGRLAMRCGEQTFVASAGDYVVVPVGVPHTFRVLGTEPVRMLQVHDDDSFLRFIKAAGVPATSATVPTTTQLSIDFDDMPRVAAQTGQPVIGPPMTQEEAQQIAAAVASG